MEDLPPYDPMGDRRIRIGVEDREGVKYDIKLEGRVTKAKVMNIFEMLDLIDIEGAGAGRAPAVPETQGGKIWALVAKYHPLGQFTTTDIRDKYEDEYNSPIKLSIVSTYLARFAKKGRISRSRAGRGWAYQAAAMVQEGAVRI